MSIILYQLVSYIPRFDTNMVLPNKNSITDLVQYYVLPASACA